VYADALCAARRLEEALAAVDHGLDIARQTHERFVESDLLRIRGNLLALGVRRDEARAAYREAIDIAGSSGWSAFETRARDGLTALEAGAT
jgi:predicted negative regulator of RcsB-dependent stress response